MFSWKDQVPLPVFGAELCGGAAFDPERRCFWASSDQCWWDLFCLDDGLRECRRLTPRFEGCLPLPITGVAVCPEGTLLVTWGGRLLEVDPERGEACRLWEAGRNARLLAVACREDCILLAVARELEVCLAALSRDGRLLGEDPLPAGILVEGLLLTGEEAELLVLGSRRDRFPCFLWGCFQEDCCEEGPCEACCCPCPEEECRCEPPCSCPCEDILESIALIEAAVAHLLNGEGEKLQRAVCLSEDVCELLEIDDSVRRTLRLAIQLEQALLSKLELLGEICCFAGSC